MLQLKHTRFVCVKETFPLGVSFTRTQNICWIGETTDNTHFGGLYILISTSL